MANNGYLRTVRMGGFDKQDVLAYVDDLQPREQGQRSGRN